MVLEADGKYTEWSEWSECSVTCGDGVQNRSRTCTNPPPQPGGKGCEDQGPADETRECNPKPCRKFIDNILRQQLKVFQLKQQTRVMLFRRNCIRLKYSDLSDPASRGPSILSTKIEWPLLAG